MFSYKVWPWIALLIVTGFGHPTRAYPKGPLEAVDPMIGTANGGNTYPGATVPFGMVQWSPDTSNGFYFQGDRFIHGFSLTHLSGAGCPVFADMPILPLGHRPDSRLDSEQVEQLSFEHSHELAQPGYYSVVLSNGTRVELTASDRSGMARITYAAGEHPGLLINGAGSASTDVHMKFLPPIGRESDAQSLTVAGDGTITGTVTAGGFCGSQTRYTLHVAYRIKSKAIETQLWADGALSPKASKADGKRAVAWLDLGKNRRQLLAVGLSYVSEANALANLQSEMPDWDFDAARRNAQQRWSTALEKIQIEGASTVDQRIFYTGLYHMLVSPTLFSDVDGEYMGFDWKVHHLQAGQRGQYTNISDWDTYRNTVQLQALLFPAEASDLAQSLVNDAEQLGSLPRWATANEGSYVMGGDSPAILLASLSAFGAKRFDKVTALDFMRRGALQPGLGKNGRFERDDLAEYLRFGYITAQHSLSASETLEFANADFAIAQMADELGDRKASTLFWKRAANWRNLLDPETHWIRPRNADGTWLAGFDAEKSLPHRPEASVPTDQFGFEEGNTYQYTFMVPFDYQGLFNLIGDKDLVERRLDLFFRKLVCWGEPCFNMANEPDFVTPYAYSFLGKPWKTADVISRIEAESFNVTSGGIPGNDDLGATSGVYVWNTLGMYPAIPGLSGVVLGTPRFQTATLHLGSGGSIKISRRGSGHYVHSVSINGSAWNSTWVQIGKRLAADTKINFEMQTTADPSWGAEPESRPPSLSAPERLRSLR